MYRESGKVCRKRVRYVKGGHGKVCREGGKACGEGGSNVGMVVRYVKGRW